MFDLGWTELLVIGIVALIVVGPKDLPKMFRSLGQFTAKARSMAREFQRAMDEAADASGVKDVARDLRKSTDPQGMGLDELNKMRKWDPMKDDAKGKKGKTPDKPDTSDSSVDDEEAMDRISAEMENLRRERAPRPAAAQTPAETGADAESSEPSKAAPASEEPASKDAPDKSKA